MPSGPWGWALIQHLLWVGSSSSRPGHRRCSVKAKGQASPTLDREESCSLAGFVLQSGPQADAKAPPTGRAWSQVGPGPPPWAPLQRECKGQAPASLLAWGVWLLGEMEKPRSLGGNLLVMTPFSQGSSAGCSPCLGDSCHRKAGVAHSVWKRHACHRGPGTRDFPRDLEKRP